MARWRFVLTDLQYNPVGEILNAYDRKVALPLSKMPSLSFRVRLDNNLVPYMDNCAGYVKAYRDNSLQYFGPIISAEEVGNAQGATLSVNSAGAAWIFQKRIAGKSAAGSIFSQVLDRAFIFKSLLDTANLEDHTGIGTSLGPWSSASAVTYVAGPYKKLSECLGDLSVAFDGFDWSIDPVDNYVGGVVTSTVIGQMRAAPVLGSLRPDAIFEFGFGRKNIAEYRRTVSRDTQADKVYHIASAGPDAPGYPVVSAIDASAISDWKLLEDLAQADILDQGMRQNLANEHVRVRAQPRQVIQFTPHIDPQGTGRVPEFGADYGVGDRIRARAKYGSVIRFDGYFRVYGVSFELDNNGVERATLSLVEEE